MDIYCPLSAFQTKEKSLGAVSSSIAVLKFGELNTLNNVIIYHNPQCSKSCATLELILQSGITPEIIEYLKTPPDRTVLEKLLRDGRMEARDLLRSNEDIYQQLELSNEELSDESILDAMIAHPILINRPIVATSLGTRLCRPAERVLEILEPKNI